MKAIDNPVELAETARIFRRALARRQDAAAGTGGPVDVEPDRPGSDAGGRTTACTDQDARAVPATPRPAARASTTQ